MIAHKDKILLIDIDSCVRCYACEIACRQEHGLTFETASRWCRVVTIGPRKTGETLQMDFVPVLCFHCHDPACAIVCPAGAIFRNEAGLVVVDEKACNGCRACLYACPYGCISFNSAEGVAGHCDLCAERVEADIEPACVQHCIGGAMQFVSREELTELTSGQHSLLMGKICYTSARWPLQINID